MFFNVLLGNVVCAFAYARCLPDRHLQFTTADFLSFVFSLESAFQDVMIVSAPRRPCLRFAIEALQKDKR